MNQSSKKIIIFYPAVVLAVLLAGRTIAAEDAQLQPQFLVFSGISALKQADPNLSGDGVKIAVISRSFTYLDGEPQNDYRPNAEHNSFKDKEFEFNEDTDKSAGVSPHSTAVCSILFGNDPNAYNQQLGHFSYQGIVPQAQGQVYEFWHFLTNNVFCQSAPDTDVITASIGTGFEDWWTRGIESMAEHSGIVVVAGIGNGLDSYDSVLYPAAGSNVIGVGIVDSVNTEDFNAVLANFALSNPEHSSMGPTADARCKPDIVAPGNCMAADYNEPNLYEPTGNWSSFSTPVVTGAISLLLQKAKSDEKLAGMIDPNGGNCVVKAILMNSAKKLAFWHKGNLEKEDDHRVPLDYLQGAGMLDAVGAYKQLTAGQFAPNEVPQSGWDLNQLDGNEPESNIYKIKVAEPNNKIITVTLVWNRHYETSYPFESLAEKNSNMRLEVRAVDANEPNKAYLLDYSDSSVDNVEHIYCRLDPNYNNYEIILSFGDSNESQIIEPYGLAWRISDIADQNNICWYDLNADGIVNTVDVTILQDNITKPAKDYPLGDINNDGAIDIKDLGLLMDQQNRTADWYKTE